MLVNFNDWTNPYRLCIRLYWGNHTPTFWDWTRYRERSSERFLFPSNNSGTDDKISRRRTVPWHPKDTSNKPRFPSVSPSFVSDSSKTIWSLFSAFPSPLAISECSLLASCLNGSSFCCCRFSAIEIRAAVRGSTRYKPGRIFGFRLNRRTWRKPVVVSSRCCETLPYYNSDGTARILTLSDSVSIHLECKSTETTESVRYYV